MERFAGEGKLVQCMDAELKEKLCKARKKKNTRIIDSISYQMFFSVQSDQKSTNGNGKTTARSPKCMNIWVLIWETDF